MGTPSDVSILNDYCHLGHMNFLRTLMKRSMMTAALAALSTGLLISGAAHAGVNLVQNGGFSEDSLGTAHEFGASHDGQTLTDWTSPSATAFNVYFPEGAALGPNADTRFGENGQYLHVLPGDADPNGGAFVALDGDPDYNGPLEQTINGLTPGAKYTVSFDWAAAQYADRTGPTTEQFQVSFGGATQSTAIVPNSSESATDWMQQSFTFTAGGASQVLSFLSVGTPSGLPPVALLDGVSLTAVPEPATWAVMLVGFGGVGAMMRRRALKASQA
jgi:hypothetical protein